MLVLKRDPDADQSESYNVFFEGRYVGRIYKAVSHAPREAPWFWGLEFHERRHFRSCKAGVPHRVGSQTEGARKRLGYSRSQPPSTAAKEDRQDLDQRGSTFIAN